jgi:hypothetical protein
MRATTLLSITLALLVAQAAFADEGMWTYNHFPSEQVSERYGFTPDQAWLDHVRLSSVRLAGGCSASVVSADGLVMTNHHCAHPCVERLSSEEKDYVEQGFYAAGLEDEARCPQMELNQLVEITDVTARIGEATKGLTGKAYADAKKGTFAAIEKVCATSDELRCEVVTLYHGGRYDLYKYQRFQDVRLVFAPEFAVAFFGGDPDNFMFPRYNLDVAFVRIYEDGKPRRMDHHLAWSPEGVKPGDLTFVSGNPGRTSRLHTTAHLAYKRDTAIPERLFGLLEKRGYLTGFAQRGEEQTRVSKGTLFYTMNGVKALKGMREALLEPRFFSSKVASERALEARVNDDADMKAHFGGAWQEVETAIGRWTTIRKKYARLELARGFWSRGFDIARTLVRAAAELPKPNAERLEEFSDARRPALEQRLFSPAPIYPEFEEAKLSFALTGMREDLGPDHPVIKKILGGRSPDEVAKALITGTRLADVATRRALYEGGREAVEASEDPMIALARVVDPFARGVRKMYEDEVKSVLDKASEKIAQARFAAHGTAIYPDATFTLRLSFGAVEGWQEGRESVHPITTVAGLFARATGSPPFALPRRWLDARERLPQDTPMNFCTTNDIIGGNSGSPVVDREGRVVGLIFDGNLHSLGGDYGFDPNLNRAVAVHSTAIIKALEVVYEATRVRDELLGP